MLYESNFDVFSVFEYFIFFFIIVLQEQMQVNLQLRISPQHHDIVKGKNNINLLKIMEHTNTKVGCFSD